MKENYHLLNGWLNATVGDNPEIITEAKNAFDIYSKLYEIWLSDVQKELKQIIKNIKP